MVRLISIPPGRSQDELGDLLEPLGAGGIRTALTLEPAARFGSHRAARGGRYADSDPPTRGVAGGGRAEGWSRSAAPRERYSARAHFRPSPKSLCRLCGRQINWRPRPGPVEGHLTSRRAVPRSRVWPSFVAAFVSASARLLRNTRSCYCRHCDILAEVINLAPAGGLGEWPGGQLDRRRDN